MDIPLLSVCLITYNHVNFIKQAIDGVLMQKVDFAWELIIADDFSTDGTREILLEYKNKYPDFIKLILQEKNVGSAQNFIDLITVPISKYITYFDGDDYWIDPLKLQKQVDFLEANPDFAICFHKVEILENNQIKNDYITNVPHQVSTIVDLAKGNFIHSPSCVFKNNISKILGPNFSKSPLGDYYVHIMNAQYGDIFCIDEIMAVYRVHEKSIWSSKTEIYRLQKTLEAMICILLDLSDTALKAREQLRLTIINLTTYIYQIYPIEFMNEHHVHNYSEKFIIKILTDEIKSLRTKLEKSNFIYMLISKLLNRVKRTASSIVISHKKSRLKPSGKFSTESKSPKSG